MFNNLLKADPYPVMGILNVTPDSFSDGGRFAHLDRAVEQAGTMVELGASIIDIGGESTRPGAPVISAEEELSRVIPVVKAIKSLNIKAYLSIDTSKPEVMRQAVCSGVDIINDVRALRVAGAKTAVTELMKDYPIGVVLMHMQGEPQDMQLSPLDTGVMAEVKQFFRDLVGSLEAAGMNRQCLCIDPGFGFGKTLDANYRLLAGLRELHEFDLPILAGMSRKSMIGNLIGKPVDQRVYAGIAAQILALESGASIIRTHDVGPAVDALTLWRYQQKFRENT